MPAKAKDSAVTPKKASSKLPKSTRSPKVTRSPKIKKTTVAKKGVSIKNEDNRHTLIATAAYYRAEKRGFKGNGADAMQDWLEAEMEIDNVRG